MRNVIVAGLVVIAACGAPEPRGPGRAAAVGPVVTRLCTSACAKCAAAEAAGCKEKCQARGKLRVVEHASVELADAVAKCLDAAECAGTADERVDGCRLSTRKDLPVNEKARATCAKLDDFVSRCGDARLEHCTENMKLVAGADLDRIAACATDTCRAGVHCIREAKDEILE